MPFVGFAKPHLQPGLFVAVVVVIGLDVVVGGGLGTKTRHVCILDIFNRSNNKREQVSLMAGIHTLAHIVLHKGVNRFLGTGKDIQ